MTNLFILFFRCIRQNVCNYWLPTAIKYYPNIIQLLYDRVIEKYNVIQKHCWVTKEMYCKNRNIDELQRYLHSVILIVKLERPAKFNTITYNCVQEALKCSDELIRGDAFLCCQTFNGVKSHVPMQGMSAESCQVFQDIFQFLEENINCDDANLRQTIYKVFKNYVRNTEGQFHKCAVPIDLVVRYVKWWFVNFKFLRLTEFFNTDKIFVLGCIVYSGLKAKPMPKPPFVEKPPVIIDT